MSKILIVDDRPEIRHLLTITLGSRYEVMNASDGASGLAAIREHRPKAVLLDIMMPGEIDGLDVLRIVKSDPELKETFVALVTSRGQKADYQLGIDLGADAYFVKPFSPLKVAAWMRERIS